jgi:hypothetical protein
MLRHKLPPPERFTFKDGVQILFGLIMIPLGATILYDTFIRGSASLGLLVGCAFMGFGIYRTLLAAGRLRWFYSRRRSIKHD